MSLAFAFLRRDWLVFTSYRLQMVWRLWGVFVFVAIVYLVGTALGDATRFPGSGSGYVSFVLGGLAFTDLLFTVMRALPGALRDAQMSGTLEAMLLSPVGVPRLLLGSSIFSIVESSIRVAIVGSITVLLLGYWRSADVVGVALVLVPGCLVFAAIGLLSASFVLAFKQGDPVLAIFTMLSWTLGGTVFPVDALPEWARPISSALPLTYVLNGLRSALAGEGIPAGDIVGLWVGVAVLVPAALFALQVALRRAQREGSLVQY